MVFYLLIGRASARMVLSIVVALRRHHVSRLPTSPAACTKTGGTKLTDTLSASGRSRHTVHHGNRTVHLIFEAGCILQCRGFLPVSFIAPSHYRRDLYKLVKATVQTVDGQDGPPLALGEW
jgi:hypothetical protein